MCTPKTSNNGDFQLKEACGVFACYNFKNAPQVAYYGLHALQHRGQDACGIAWLDGDKLQVNKAPGLLRDVFSDFLLEKMCGQSAIGHTRYATTGDDSLSNVQPFYFKHKDKEFALAHNGNIANSVELKKELEEKGSVFFGTSDTEILGHMLVRQKSGDLFNNLLKILKKVEGAFSLTLIDKNGIYAVRDRWGFRPLVIGKKDASYVIASETCSLDIIGATMVANVQPGQVVHINQDGMKIQEYAKPSRKRSLGAMELIYFARPDSTIDGINVHKFRKKCGEKLAELFPARADIVVPIPDSSISAALGYAEKSKIPYEMGLVKNRYVARTFIEADQDTRVDSVFKKLNAVRSIVEGKEIVLIDDSIVRGTTIKSIITMLRRAGTKTIHMRVASPKIIAPSYYGINISTYKELVAHHYPNTKELAKFIGADTLEFLPIKSLQEIAHPVGLDTCIFTDVYPTKISKELVEEAKK